MSGPVERFEADWLTLREPADHVARAEALTEGLAVWCAARTGGRRPLRVVDLGSGTGSNLRWLAPRLAARPEVPQAWTLVDHDAGLLARARRLSEAHPPGGAASVTTLAAPLTGVGGRLDPALAEVIAGADVVTASALLDLLSASALHAVVDATVRAGAAALLALSYDGTIVWTPSDADDDRVRDAVNAHQRRDKGTGPALGPTAGDAAAEAFGSVGYRVESAGSAWVLGPAEVALAGALLDGWSTAATEQAPHDADRLVSWAARRREVLGGAFELRVGHLDVLALPA